MAESQVKIAQKTWEMSNNILEVSAGDEIYKYDRQQQQSLLAAKPWDKDPHFFKDIKISALALLKMVMHARSGGNLEIMRLLLGKVCSNLHPKEPPSPCRRGKRTLRKWNWMTHFLHSKYIVFTV